MRNSLVEKSDTEKHSSRTNITLFKCSREKPFLFRDQKEYNQCFRLKVKTVYNLLFETKIKTPVTLETSKGHNITIIHQHLSSFLPFREVKKRIPTLIVSTENKEHGVL